MPSLPLTPQEEQKILETLRLQNVEDLFKAIPPKIRETANFKIDLGPYNDGSGRGLTEHELRVFFGQLGEKNAFSPAYTHFLGGGVYDNVIPAIVNQLVLRGEFLTCYTPYQPEVSQGTLQAVFEFQTMICRMTGMQVSNASMYDGATATAEAILMAQRCSNAKGVLPKVLIAENLNPDYLTVCNTFLSGQKDPLVPIPYTEEGILSLQALSSLVEKETPCAVVVGYPNYFGLIEPLDKIKSLLPKGCLLIVTCQDPSALSIYEAPGNLGADIVVGEAHQLGTPMLFGGPHVGFFATKKEFIRQMPGRLCGESVDSRGNRAYTLTLSTREQHIRREKATSNICTNQGLIALRTVIYLSFLGKSGFEKLGEMNHSLFHYLLSGLQKKGIKPLFNPSEHYREGVFQVPNLDKRFQNALTKKCIPGIRLKTKFKNPSFKDTLLISVHPKHTKAHLDTLIEVLSHD